MHWQGTLHRGAAGGLDQFVLEFERAERRKAGLSHVALFLAAFLFCHDAFSNVQVNDAGVASDRSVAAGVREIDKCVR
jgi:hypothetical protein